MPSEHEVSKVTGLTFDRYIAVDFIAFRDMVNALGGVDVCLTTDLDDTSYPDYTGGYHPIHFKAGCQHLNGEQALEIARSRHAIRGRAVIRLRPSAPPAGHHGSDQEEDDLGERFLEGARSCSTRFRRTSPPTCRCPT